MKKLKNVACGFGILVGTFIVGVLAWIFIFSDCVSKGYMSANDWINIAFFVLFAVVLFFACKGLYTILCTKARIESATKVMDEHFESSVATEEIEWRSLFDKGPASKLFCKYLDEKDAVEKKQDSSCTVELEYYFNIDNFGEYFRTNMLDQIPGVLTGIGMLGTFVGLSIGLSKFSVGGNSDEIKSNIEPLMSCIQLAFITSIFGLVLSILFNMLYRRYLSTTYDEISDFVQKYNKYTERLSNEEFNLLLNNQNDELDILSSLSDTIADNIAATLKVEMQRMETTYLDACQMMITSNEKACKLMSESHEAALKEMVSDFTEQVFGKITRGIEELYKSIEYTIEYQESTTERIKSNIESIISLSDNTTRIHELSVSTVEKLKEYTDHLDANTQSLLGQVEENNEIMRSAEERLESFTSLAEQMEEASQRLAQFSEDVSESNMRLMDNVATQLEKLTQSQNEISDKMVDSIKASVLESKTSIEETVKVAQLQISAINTSGENLITAINKATDSYKEDVNEYSNTIARQAEDYLNRLSDIQNSAISKMTEPFTSLTDSMKSSVTTIKESTDSFRNSINGVSTITDNLNEYSKELPKIIEGMIESSDKNTSNQLSMIVDKMNSINANLTSENNKNVQAINTLKKSLDETNSLIKEKRNA